MDNGQIMRLRIMRVSITSRGLTMSCPTGMSNTYTTANILVSAVFGQVVNLPFCLKNIKLIVSIY